MKNRRVRIRFAGWVCIMLVVVLFVNSTVNPVEVGAANVSSRDIREFKQELDKQVPTLQKKYDVPGVAIGLVHEGRISEILHYGYADKKQGIPLSENTLFQAGSISKSVTAWGIMHLVEEGRISLDDPVEKYLTEWKFPESGYDHQEVTIRRLLSHTAGLPPHKGYVGTEPEEELYSLVDSLNGEGRFNEPTKIIGEPGTEAAYSGAGYSILQLLIEEVTGMSFEAYMEEQVLKPLGMNASSFRQDAADPSLSKAYGYFGQEIPNYLFTEKAAAGLKTNASDMMALIIASLNRGNKLAEEMQKPVMGENGLGLFIRMISDGKTFMYHSGDNRGWHALYGFVPETGDGVVILTNSDNGIDLRQDIYHAWVEYETGALPDSHSSLFRLRQTHKMISVGLAVLLGIYFIWFVIRLCTGRRGWIFSQMKKPILTWGIRTCIFAFLAWALFYIVYIGGTLDLSFGKKYIVMLIMAWFLVLVFTGFFPKKRTEHSNTSVINKTRNYND